MSFFSNRPDLLTPVRWYFAADDALPLPVPTRFGSGNWASQKYDWPGPGEVLPRNRRWVNGSRNPRYTGQFQCGTDGQFLDGTLYPPGDFPRFADGVPACCLNATCQDWWGFNDLVSADLEFTVAGFSGPSNPSDPCYPLQFINGFHSQAYGTSPFTPRPCSFSDGSGVQGWQLWVDFEAPPFIFFGVYGFPPGTTPLAGFFAEPPLPPELPYTWPMTVTFDEGAGDSCGGLGYFPSSFSLTLTPRFHFALPRPLPLRLKLDASVVAT